MSIPENFATDIARGAQFGYLLLWVVLVANVMALLVQSISAELGIATRANLAEVRRDLFPDQWSLVCGFRPRSSRWPPISPSSLVQLSA